MAQMYRYLSMGAFSLAGISFCLAVGFWFKFQIWKLLGDLSGRNARRSVEQMRRKRETSGGFPYPLSEMETDEWMTEKWEG